MQSGRCVYAIFTVFKQGTACVSFYFDMQWCHFYRIFRISEEPLNTKLKFSDILFEVSLKMNKPKTCSLQVVQEKYLQWHWCKLSLHLLVKKSGHVKVDIGVTKKGM